MRVSPAFLEALPVSQTNTINLALSFTETVPLYRDRYAEEVSAYTASKGKRKSTNHLTTDIKGPDEVDAMLETMDPSVVEKEIESK